ncbi:FtsH protease activity modulator HflK [Buchnera aphidicola]|uniref:Protein HflK n=1 Tax=Buchnera aphidicola subsp. Acyrthosiphon pisum (strain 5A) TaxID=563178 RepID=A0A7U4DII7_BUCA5|nr:FtsH protease activity modulator HflK [Buchnera aphidicola]ADP66945.1 HflK protein [Buchnera aphidicola str. TLW03 (Acyrthosiphon pisum)]OQX99568.1 MAG: protein HflK [Erwiniaceae bacterium 4572_131]ACL30354.1 HflK protein [Buchnera aphidicola str. Tuc7 (Acyrthosiphon pisum)]ACL30908.1 HflK protein [Buchnera aphidicola str. 5A (Acyrthosiphon pisum)]ADP66370.1 HflK protein [Buchnera aphidicola str. LL01 (Acyrthosiphon pisum)]
MVWNKPNNNKPDFDPWGNKDSKSKNCSDNKHEKKTTVLDIKNFLYNLKNIITKKTDSSNSSKKITYPFSIIIFISFFIWGVSGFYTITEAERGVVTSFGKFSHLVQPGLNWRPVFFNEVKPVNVETVRELATSGIMLTSDENVVRVEMNVQYKITNPADYLFSVCYPDDSLRQATDSALRGVIGHSTMDRVLTEGRTLVRSDTQKEIENTIKPYKMGITILDVNFQTARPPEEVKAAFDDAIAARENREQYVREAEAYSNEVKPKANGKAQRILEEAKSYSSRIILQAQGEVARFSKILPEYRIAKKITLKRLYIESMERLLRKNKKIFIDTNNNPMFFFSLDNFFSKIKIPNKNFKDHIKINKNHSPFNKKVKNTNYFPFLSPDNISEQRRINSIRSDLKKIGRE